MGFLKIVKRRSFLNEVIYVLLNIGLSLSLMVIVRVTGSVWPAFVLVFLSKWRVFAVRPQFWFANIQANLVSTIASVSYVVFLYIVNSTVNISEFQILVTQLLFVVMSVCWLLFLKPKSKRIYTVAQAGVAVLLGVTAVYSSAYNWPASMVVLFVWLIGYSTARHVLSSYDEESHIVFLSLIWGFVLSEIGWLAYHWTIAYQLPFMNNLLLPQVSIIMLCLGFLVYKSYDSYYHHQKIRMNDILLPLIFTIGVTVVLMLAFNGVTTNIS